MAEVDSVAAHMVIALIAAGGIRSVDEAVYAYQRIRAVLLGQSGA